MGTPRRYMFDDAKLRNHALLELSRNLRTDRMIALTGSMATEALGYFSWKDFCKKIGDVAISVSKEARVLLNNINQHDSRRMESFISNIIEQGKALQQEAENSQPKTTKKLPIDKRVQINVIRESLAELDLLVLKTRHPSNAFDPGWAADDQNTLLPLARFNKAVADTALARRPTTSTAGIEPLIENLGVSRFATLNYDLELERALMLRRDESALLDTNFSEDKPPHSVMKFVTRDDDDDEESRQHHSSPARPISLDRLKRLHRVLGDGDMIESDILDRERPDRLFEFAIGSPETTKHILHLHGRADLPDSMIVDMRDYDELYRLDDLYRNPFEHGLRVLLAGNPILFVGLGMSEAEINHQLQYFVSNSPHRRMAPAFLIWNTISFADDDDARAAIKARRIDFLQRLGIHVIFDQDVMPAFQLATMRAEYASLKANVSNLEKARKRAEGAMQRTRTIYAKIMLDHGPGDTELVQAEAAANKAKIADEAANKKLTSAREALRNNELSALAATIDALPAIVTRINLRANRTASLWRSIDLRLERREDRGSTPDEPVRLWGTIDLREHTKERDQNERLVWTRPKQGHQSPEFKKLLVGTAEPGFGRGALAEEIVQANFPADEWGFVRECNWDLQHTTPGNRLLINAGFSYDSDAMLNAIAQFLARRRFGDSEKYTLGKFSRERLFANPNLYLGDNLLVVMNGVDRFFGFDGAPLSAELDHLFRCILRTSDINPTIQWVLLGTDRVRRYFDGLGWPTSPLQRPSASKAEIGSCYLDSVRNAFMDHAGKAMQAGGPTASVISAAAEAKIEAALLVDRDAVRRAFYAGYLSPVTLDRLGISSPLAFEILRTLAYIGTPVETHVLRFAPRVDAMLRETHPNADETDQFFLELMGLLSKLRLLIEIAPFNHRMNETSAASEPVTMATRFGLHRSLATELRERLGVPLSEAKLSTTFNMSLFAAQPGENFVPKSDFHGELGELVDRLTGSWNDANPFGELPGHIGIAFNKRMHCRLCEHALKIDASALNRARSFERQSLVKDGVEDTDPDFQQKLNQRVVKYLADIVRKNDPEDPLILVIDKPGLYSHATSSNLRAALSVLRGYYSTASFLGLDHRDPILQRSEEAPLSDHAVRLDRLLRNFGRIAAARAKVRELTEDFTDRAIIEEHLGPEPFYPDDLIWLHNERGVVKLVQGHLYDARRSLSLAQRENAAHLEHGHRGHNWRRIGLNTIGLLIERGRFRRAGQWIDEIEASINAPVWGHLASAATESDPSLRHDGTSTDRSRVEAIRRIFGNQTQVIDDCASADFSREEILTIGLTTGYRGLIAHMRGRYRTGQEHYVRAISILRRLGEQRAYAIFQRHYATLRRFTGGAGDLLKEIEYGIAASASVRQLDISYRSRIVRAAIARRDPSTDALRRRLALEEIREALEYAARSDIYRLRIEASAALAREMRSSGDYDAALQYAADALSSACRYGHSLHKISMRVEIGQILIQRGDPKSGAALIDHALASAMQKGNQRTVDLVQRSLSNDLARPHAG